MRERLPRSSSNKLVWWCSGRAIRLAVTRPGFDTCR